MIPGDARRPAALPHDASRRAPPNGAGPRPPGRAIGLPLGLALAAGVPTAVLVAAGPVAALAGSASLIVWPLSALVGLLMAFSFAELVSRFPERRGGIAVASAAVLRPHSRQLAALAQWSYWLGWSPALAISAALIADYAHAHYLSSSSRWLSWAIAIGILLGAAFVNHFGIRPSAWVQLALVASLVVPVLVLALAPVVDGTFDLQRISLHLPHGWTTWQGLGTLGGALFLAGWSAYGAEVALTYSAEYKRRAGDAVRTVLVTATGVLLVCAVGPMLLLGGLGVHGVADDPTATVLAPGGAGSWLERVAVPVLLVSFLLTLNLISGSDARVLYEMGRNGETWSALGRLNADGAPQNALLFDAGANATFLAAALVATGGNLAAVPSTLLIAANIGYLVSLMLALVASWLARRERNSAAPAYRAPRSLVPIGLGLAVLNGLLLVAASSVWGWPKIGLGILLLAAVALAGTRRARTRLATSGGESAGAD